MIVFVTQSYDGLGNIDLEFLDLEKLPVAHPYRLAVEKAMANRNRVGVLENSESVFSGERGSEFDAARVSLPATVQAAVHLRVRD